MFLLPTTPSRLHGGVLAGAVLLRTLLQTGLFIVAHDAMHGSLWPGRPRRNHGIGQAALLLYGALPYGKCLSNHHRHHRHAGTADDPDHHGQGQGQGRETWIGWYATFMASYLSARQILSLAVLWGAWAAVAWFVTPTPLQNIGLFCILPHPPEFPPVIPGGHLPAPQSQLHHLRQPPAPQPGAPQLALPAELLSLRLPLGTSRLPPSGLA